MSLSTDSFAILSSSAATNAALVDRCQHRDEPAFAEIFKRHRDLIYRVCLRYVGHHHDAEDMTQETFRRAAAAISRVDSQRPIEPWLVTIAANRCRSFLSRRQGDRSIGSLEETKVTSDRKHDHADRLSLGEQLDLALQRLPANQRHAFELIHQRELTYPEAARVMGRPMGTVKTWVRRAKRGLQDTLRAAESEVGSMPPASAVAPASAVISADDSQLSAAEFRPGRRTAVGVVATALLLGCLIVANRSPSQVSPLASVPGSHLLSPAPAVVEPLPAGGDVQRHSGAPAHDWQWASLNAFLHTRLSVEGVRALPLNRWMQQTSPALGHLHSGIKPLSSTLHRVAELFQCEVAQTSLIPGAEPGELGRDGAGEYRSSIDAGTSGQLDQTTTLTQRQHRSIA
ncbi:RNA polymerase sigma factor [Allorhodopirellula solitaria]|uniref:ECF RNA polymerase sigma factor SigW n=1 Tax=Allorhodopirellula solitaria TaxID=2527987 RepID=A0A5C5YE24_9BACT|nr:sigma-70 family RNA polymerase sigma factor [Allorhodopirellula solitaria]TWT73189.1 ECF RNA polymerase sigma factor SigW [Allorhodopirellula solitaria]